MVNSCALSGDHRSLLSRTFTVALDLAHALRGIDDQTGDAEAAQAFVNAKESRRELERLLNQAAGLMGQLPPELSRAIACLSDAVLQPRRNGNSSFADAARALAAAGLDGPARDGMGYLQSLNQSLLSKVAALTPYFPLIAIAAEVTWNLREWVRESHERPNLKPVLQARLPHLCSRLELELVHSHLANAAAELPSGDQLTAAALIGFVEGLQLPNGTKVKIPAGEPLVKWPTLSRIRATQIAMQVVGENNELLFDPENPDDLNEIELLDGDYLAQLWQATEAHNQSPMGAPSAADPVTGGDVGPPKRPKKSTQKGEAHEKLISVLTTHHHYMGGQCSEWSPVGVNELAKMAQTSSSSSVRFFKATFGSHMAYSRLCRDRAGQQELAKSLKRLNGESTRDRQITDPGQFEGPREPDAWDDES